MCCDAMLNSHFYFILILILHFFPLNIWILEVILELEILEIII